MDTCSEPPRDAAPGGWCFTGLLNSEKKQDRPKIAQIGDACWIYKHLCQNTSPTWFIMIRRGNAAYEKN